MAPTASDRRACVAAEEAAASPPVPADEAAASPAAAADKAAASPAAPADKAAASPAAPADKAAASPAAPADKAAANCEPAPMRVSARSLSLLVALHALAVWGTVRGFTVADRRTAVSAVLWGIAGGLGVTAGAHRLWAHRTYRARLPLRVLLMLLFTVAGENDLFEWVRDHRLHHRHSETDADPHNARRGFFFAHCGWLMVRKHPAVMREGAKTDMSDMRADPVVAFQQRHYIPLVVLMTFALPTLLPWLCWGESLATAFLVCGALKYACTLHCTWLVNSAAHIWGMHPYETGIRPAENRLVAVAALGEGWHNYHHVFPWDYRTAELPGYCFNLTTGFIDLCQLIGWAYDCKTVPREVVARRALRTGDGSWRGAASARTSGARLLRSAEIGSGAALNLLTAGCTSAK